MPTCQENLARCYKENYDSLLETAQQLLGDADEAEDALQETLERLLLHLDEYDASKSRLLTWVRRAVHHRCIDILRGRPYTKPPDPWFLYGGSDPRVPRAPGYSMIEEREAKVQERREEMTAKIKQWLESDEEVPEKARAVIRDYYILRLGTFPDVCGVHGVSVRWGWYKVKAAFKRWRERLATDGE